MAHEIGVVRATFELVAKNLNKTVDYINKKITETEEKAGRIPVGVDEGKASKSTKLLKELESARTMDTKALKENLKETKLNENAQKNLSKSVQILKKDYDANLISFSKYTRGMKELAKQNDLQYKNDKFVDPAIVAENKAREKAIKEKSKLLAQQKKQDEAEFKRQEALNNSASKKLFMDTQLVTARKAFGKEAKAYLQEIDKFGKLLDDNKIGMGAYTRATRNLTDKYDVSVLKNGYVIESKMLNEINQRKRDYISWHKMMLDSQRKGIPVSNEISNSLNRLKFSEAELNNYRRMGIISNKEYSGLLTRVNGDMEAQSKSMNNLTSSYGSLNNAHNMVTRSQRMQNYAMQVAAMRYNALGLAVGTTAGLVGGVFIQNFMMARTTSIQLDQQMQQMFQTMNLGTGAFQDFNKALDEYVNKFPKVNKYAVGSTIAQVGKLNGLNLDQMKKAIPVVSDIQNMMMLNGRTMEDATLAINDAFDGQFKRLQEIGVQGKEQLEKLGYTGTADSLLSALEKLDKQKGWSDLTKNVSTASDAFMILGNALDRIIVPTINMLTPLIVMVSVAIGDFVTWLSKANPVVSGLTAVLIIAGGAFALMKAQMAWASLMGSSFMASMTGLDSGMQRVNTTMFHSAEVAKMQRAEFLYSASSNAKLEWESAKLGETLDSSNGKVKKTGVEWNKLSESTQKNITATKALDMQWQGLSRTQRMEIDTLSKSAQISRVEATARLYERDTILANNLAKQTSNTIETESFLTRMRGAFATGVQSVSNTTNTASTEGNTVAKTANIVANGILTTTSYTAGVAVGFLTSAMGVALIAVVAVAGAIYLLTESQRSGIDAMKQYNDFLEKGEETIKSLWTATDTYKEKAYDLERVRDQLKAQGKDVTQIEADIATAYENSSKMATQAKNAEDALKLGREKDKQLDADHLTNQNEYNSNMLNMMKEKGLINEQQYNEEKQYNALVLAGANQKYTAEQRTQRIRDIGAMQNEKIMKGDHNYSKAFIEDQKNGGKAVQDRVKAYDELAQAKYKAETSDDWMTSISAWFEQGGARLKIGWIDTVMQWQNFWMGTRAWWDGQAEWWGGLWTRISEIGGETGAYLQGAWNNTLKAFGDAGAYIQGAWGNTVDFFVGIGQGIYNALRPVICVLLGCSPGIVPAIQQMYSVAVTIFGSLISVIQPIVVTLVGIFQGIITAVSNLGINFYNIVNVWNVLVFIAQTTWTTIYTVIVDTANSIWIGTTDIWNGMLGSVYGTWGTISGFITGTMSNIWSNVSSIAGSISSAFSGMASSVIGSASSVQSQVMGYIQPLWDQLKSFWNFVSNPSEWFGGAGGYAGSPELGSGYAGSLSAGSTKGLSRSYRSSSGGNNLFAGLGNTIINQVGSAVDSTGVTHDPRFGYAGDPDLITDPYRCEDPKKCYAGGWDYSNNWIDSAKNLISNWVSTIGNTTISVGSLLNGNGASSIFDALATRLISGTAYQFYYGDGKSNSQALADGSFNCWDGAEILLDLAHGLGLTAYMGKGTWDNFGHVWAVVNGKNYDTTAFQRGYGWTSPKVTGYAGSPNNRSLSQSNVQIRLDFSGAIFFGMEDVENKMKAVADKVFNEKLGKNPIIGF